MILLAVIAGIIVMVIIICIIIIIACRRKRAADKCEYSVGSFVDLSLILQVNETHQFENMIIPNQIMLHKE